ncbi:hypothetical protein [Micromonospora sp. NPDC005652]|uniref:hypothetical protein n=1 Tax=Micromonospora sp. NPDC005652 TaxID=3157046 RepID=UPI0033E215AB
MNAPEINPGDWHALEVFDEATTAYEVCEEALVAALYMSARLAQVTGGDEGDIALAVSAMNGRLRRLLDDATVLATARPPLIENTDEEEPW